MLDSGWSFLIAILAPLLLAGALFYAFCAQRMTPQQRRDLTDAMDGRLVDEEADDGCPVRVEKLTRSRQDNRERMA